MKKYFTYVCLLALALFAFATHAEAGKFKFKLKTAVGVKIDFTKIFPDCEMTGVKIEGLTKDSTGTPVSGLQFASPNEMNELYLDTDHAAGAKEITVEDPNNVIKKIHFTTASGIGNEDLTMLEFDAGKPMDLVELSFAGMKANPHFTIANAVESTQNLEVLDLKGAEEYYIFDILPNATPYNASKKLKKVNWGKGYNDPNSHELVGVIIRNNPDLEVLDFTETDFFKSANEKVNAQRFRKLVEYIPHMPAQKLNLHVNTVWESTLKIAGLKKFAVTAGKTLHGVDDSYVFVTRYKFGEYELSAGQTVKIDPDPTELFDDTVNPVHGNFAVAPASALYKTADGIYYSLNEQLNWDGKTCYAQPFNATVDPSYNYEFDLTKPDWYVEGNTPYVVGVENKNLTSDQVVARKVIGKKSNVQFYFTDGSSMPSFVPLDSLKFVSVKGIDNSAPTANPTAGNDENYRYGRTMTGFEAKNAPKREGYRFDKFLYTRLGNPSSFDGPDFALIGENASAPGANKFDIFFSYVPVHKVKLMYPEINGSNGSISYAQQKAFEVDHNGKIKDMYLPTAAEMQQKFPGYELRGWQFVENMKDLKPLQIEEPTITLSRADALNKVIDKDYYVVAMMSKLYTVTFRDYDKGQIAVVKTIKDISWGTLVKEDWFPDYAGREGYTAKGWSWDGQTKTPKEWEKAFIHILKEDIEFTAVYEINKYNVRFTYREKDGTEMFDKYKVEHGKKVAQTDLTYVTKEASKFANHRFEAWQLNGKDMNPAEYVVTAATEFNARYTYNPMYKFLVGSDELVSGRKVIDNKVINAPANPADEGDSEFEGWTLNGEIVNFPYTIPDANFAPGTKPNIPAQNLIFIAKYTEPFQVKFDMHGVMKASGAWKKTAKKIKKGYKLPTPQNVPEAYKFLGWSVDELNVDKLYKPGEIFTDYNADFTLHAVFHHNYNAQLNPTAIEDFCARVGSSAYPETPEKYVENYKDIVDATVTDIVDLSQVSSVVKKVEFEIKPSTEKVGNKEIKVQLTYNDGTTDQVSLIMHVVDAQSLKNIIDEANHELKNPTYTDVTALKAAIAKAQQVYDNDNACTSELEAAEKQLAAALDALTVAYKPLPEDQIEKADRVYLEYGINIQGAATYNATYGGLEVANYKVFKKGYTFVMNVTPAAGYSLQNWTIFENGKPVSTFKTFAQTLRYHFAKAGKYKVVANFTKGEYSFTYGIRNEAGKGAEFVAMYDGSVIKSGTKLPAGAKVRLIVTLQDQARIVKWFVNDAVASISPEIRDNEFTVNADTKVEVELANVTSAEAVSASVKVGPNPFTNFFVIRGAQDFATYYVLNATGNRVAEGMVAGMNEVRVNAQSFAPGFYVVVLKKADGTVQAVKMIKR